MSAFLKSILRIKNSKLLVLLLISSFSSQAGAYLKPLQKIQNPKIQQNKAFNKNVFNLNHDLFDNISISNNTIVKNKKSKNELNNNLNIDFKKIEEDTKKWFINKKNWELTEPPTQKKKNMNEESYSESKKLQNDSEGKDSKETRGQKFIDFESTPTLPNSLIQNNIDEPNTPPVGEISVGEFLIQPRGYIDLKGPKISLNLVNANVLETLKFLAKSGDYGYLYIENESKEGEEISIPQITASFTNQNYSRVFNSLLMASNLQAKFEKGIIFVGENVFNKSLEPKFSKTYRINQASAASVGDYLSTLGAKISKVLVKSSALAGDELGEGLINSADLSENFINSYGTEGGPLSGLIGTVDLRLQTITLVGDQNLIIIAEKYIKSLDVRHRQVALSVKIIDVSLTKSDLTNSGFDLLSGSTTIFNNGGLAILTGNGITPKVPGSTSPVQSSLSLTEANPLSNNQFFNWLERKITNDNAKIIASPTLILGENQEPIISGAADIDDSLGSATIGRPFANEAFIKVGENVITSFEASTTDGVTTCTATSGTAGITFGAKLNKVDDNDFVTFSLSPAISSVTKTETIANCGTQSTLSVRKLDTGIIRVKDGSTLVLTGVLKDEDTINTTKTPLLGDIPILGRLFRKNTTLKSKSELIILVTPRVINDENS